MKLHLWLKNKQTWISKGLSNDKDWTLIKYTLESDCGFILKNAMLEWKFTYDKIRENKTRQYDNDHNFYLFLEQTSSV